MYFCKRRQFRVQCDSCTQFHGQVFVLSSNPAVSLPLLFSIRSEWAASRPALQSCSRDLWSTQPQSPHIYKPANQSNQKIPFSSSTFPYYLRKTAGCCGTGSLVSCTDTIRLERTSTSSHALPEDILKPLALPSISTFRSSAARSKCR